MAGVSQGTVSLVINGREHEGRIPPETRDRVLEVAQSLGYVPNPVARRLAGGSNRLIGVFTYEPVFPTSQRDFYHPFLVGIEERAQQESYDLVLFTGAVSATGKRGIFVEGQNRIGLADGAIILGRQTNHEEILRLEREGFPFALVGRRDIPGHFPFVTADYREGTVRAFMELVRMGHRNIVYAASDEDTEPARDRRAGYRDALRDLGQGADIHEVPPVTDSELPGVVLPLVDAGATAVVTHYAESSLALETALHAHGRVVPRDVSLLALNDPPDGSGVGGLRIRRQQMGVVAFDLLLERVSRGTRLQDPHRIIPTDFEPGRTIAAPEHGQRTS